MDFQQILKWRQQGGGLNALLGIQVAHIGEGEAVVTVALTPDTLNPLGIAHGGTIYTLCDAAAGTAAASRGAVAVTMTGVINYLRPGGSGQTLRAVAQELKHGRNTAVYGVDVYDEAEKRIANCTFTMFYTDKRVEDLI